MSLSKLFDAIMDVLEFIELEGETSTIRNEASSHIAYLSSFDFAFTLHLMLAILGITHDLSQALQKRIKILQMLWILLKPPSNNWRP